MIHYIYLKMKFQQKLIYKYITKKNIHTSDFIGPGLVTLDILNIGNLNKEGIKLRFKRVSNFNKRTSQEAFVIEKQKQGLREDDILNADTKNKIEKLIISLTQSIIITIIYLV